METRTDAKSFYPRRRRRRRLDEESRKKSDNLEENKLPVGSLNNRRFKFLLFSCLMNNMICFVLLITLAFPFLTVQGQDPHPSPAGFLDFDNLPVTRFTCDGKVIGGYYADVETGCQMFHVCTLGQKDEIQDIKFLCVNGTVFDQETRVCERVDEVDCSQAEKFYDLNLDLYVPYVVTTTTTKSPEDVTTPRTTTTTTTTTTTPRTPPPAVIFSQFRPIHSYLSSQRFQHHTLKPTNQTGGKGSSSFSYFQRNPQSQHQRDQDRKEPSPLSSAEFNSNFRQSYIINHNQNDGVETETNPTGRKVPGGGGAKPIFYNPHQSFQRNYSRPLPFTTSTSTTTTTTTTTTTPPPSMEEPAEYYDEYPEGGVEDSAGEELNYQMEHQRQSKKLLDHHQNQSSEKAEKVDKRDSNSTGHEDGGTSSMEKQEPLYYDEYGEDSPVEYSDEDHAIINPNEHHFTHVDVPRIPYAKPNVPRVLVTNGKPFLPRLRRQSLHHHHHVHFLPHVYEHQTDSSATHIFLY